MPVDLTQKQVWMSAYAIGLSSALARQMVADENKPAAACAAAAMHADLALDMFISKFELGSDE